MSAMDDLKTLGCGDGYCLLAGKRSGQHTNGGCHCLADVPSGRRQRVQQALRLLHSMAGVDASPSVSRGRG